MTEAEKIRRVVNLLSERKGTQIVTIDAITPVRLVKVPKEHEIWPRRNSIKKRALVNGTLGAIYERSVNRRRESEGLEPDFEALERQWGFNLRGLPLVSHKGQLYLRFQPRRTITYTYLNEDGCVVDKALVDPFLGVRSESRQGVDKPVEVRNYALTNLRSILRDGITIELE
jgi:hypothetical protein